MTPHGPIYCETGHPWLYMAEPVNTLTNIFILIAAYLAFRQVGRSRVGYSADLSILLLLLTCCGIGSFLWHGLRTMWALQLDWIPGVLFLFVFCGFWMRQLFGRLAGVLGALGLLVAMIASIWLSWRYLGAVQPTPSPLRFVPAFATVALAGLGMVAATARKFGASAAWLGGIILLCGVAAAVFRSIDLLVCPFIPFGTHFLWHILLSTASYLSIVLLLQMKTHGRKVFA